MHVIKQNFLNRSSFCQNPTENGFIFIKKEIVKLRSEIAFRFFYITALTASL